MQKTKLLSILVAIIIVSVIIPQMAFASWWNPFSWNWSKLLNIFQKQNQVQIEKKIETPKDETSGWKTYKNNEYGFEFKYPQDWKVAKNILLSEPNLVFCPNDLATNSDPEVICKIINGGAESPKPVYANGMIYLFAYDTDFKLNNSKYHYLGSVGGKYYYLYSEKNESLITQIISTFKFTDSKIETAGWKTYRNDKYGFEFKYPEGGKIEEVVQDNDFRKLLPGQCISITYRNSYIYIGTPPYERGICGVINTGRGIDDVRVKEQIILEGKSYKSEGWKTKDNYEDLYFKTDKIDINYGIDDTMHLYKQLNEADYNKAKNLDYSILSTFKFIK